MTIEQIEKAAEEMMPYSKDVSSAGRSVFGKHYKRGFRAGAKWRINSVWHDASEKPNGMFVILIDFGDEVDAEEYGLGMTADDLNGAKRWAYILDLLPQRKEAFKNLTEK